MRILWHSVPAIYRTGYGTQTKLWTRRLAKDHVVAISSIVGSTPSYANDDGIPTLSCGPRNCMGNDFVQAHCREFKPDVLLTMSDSFAYDLNKFYRLPWAGWHMVDAEPLMPILLPAVKTCRCNIAESKFGQRVIRQAGYDAHYIPHAFDLENEWYPEDPIKARLQLSKDWETNLTGRFIVTMNSANMSRPSRKNFGAAFKAFKILLRHNPRALMYCHTEATGKLCNGENIFEMAKAHDLSNDQLYFPNQYKYMMGMFDTAYLRMVYSASDVMLNTSMGEGFGLPIIEAYACGCRVVATAFSSMIELVEDCDLVRDGILWSHIAGSNQFVVNPEAVAVKLMDHDKYYKGIPHYRALATPYDIEKVYTEKLAPLLARIAKGEICLLPANSEPASGASANPAAQSQPTIAEPQSTAADTIAKTPATDKPAQ